MSDERVYLGSPHSRQAMREMWGFGYTMADVARHWGISVQKATSIVHASPKKVAADAEVEAARVLEEFYEGRET